MPRQNKRVDAIRVRKNQDTLTENQLSKEFEEKTKEVNDIPRLIHTNNITETNNVTICRSKNGSGPNEKKTKIPENSHSDQKPNQTPWKRCLEKQLTELRAEFSKLNEMSASRLGYRTRK